jgi:hypothetical protein
MKTKLYSTLFPILCSLLALTSEAQQPNDPPKRIPVGAWTNSEIVGVFVATPVIDGKVYFTRLVSADFISSPIITNLSMQLPPVDALEAAALAKQEVAAIFGSATGWRVTSCSNGVDSISSQSRIEFP